MKISGDKFTYTKMPVPIDIVDYNKAREWITTFFAEHKDVVAVYEYGTVTSPGISDLDIMVVLKDRPRLQDVSKKLRIKNVPKRLSYLLNTNTVKFISRRHFKDINLLGEFRNNLLFGERIGFNKITFKERNLIKIATVMDFMPERVLSLMEYMKRQSMPLADIMGLLNSYLYSAEMTIDVIGQRHNGIAGFKKELKCLRVGWFKNSSQMRLGALFSVIGDGIRTGIRLIRSLGSYLISHRYYVPFESVDEAIFYFNRSKGLRFCNDSNNKNVEEGLFLDKGDRLFFLVPAVWLNHFYFYSQHKGIISSRIKNNLFLRKRVTERRIKPELARLLSSRIDLCNSMAGFLKRYRIPLNRLHRFAHIKRIKSV